MIKKFIRDYGFVIITAVVLTATFAFGFALGMYGRSASSIDEIEYTQTSSMREIAIEGKEPPVESEPAIEAKAITVTATAYCPCSKCCGKNDGITATGVKATAGRTIAVDPKVIPYGSEVIIAINGKANTYIAEDTGGAIKGNRVDIFFDNHNEALQFGVQELKATIKE